jgi:hypothetical protein
VMMLRRFVLTEERGLTLLHAAVKYRRLRVKDVRSTVLKIVLIAEKVSLAVSSEKTKNNPYLF